MAELPIVAFASSADWEEWLATQHADSLGVWLKFAKKASGIASVSFPDALDGALCYGWIDGQRRGLDESYYLQRFTPRRPRSKWSKINRGKIDALMQQGRMRPAGLREVERAKADGRWDAAYDPPSTAAVPADLQEALAASPEALSFFGTLNSMNRYAVLYRIQDAKRPETRARRVASFVAMLARHETLHP